MLHSSIKRFFTILLLLSLCGQAVVASVMSCQMDMEIDKANTAHSKCSENMSHDSAPVPETKNDNAVCDQSCDCCLGACSAAASLPNKLISLNSASLIKSSYKDLALIQRLESLYRPPITC